MALQDQKPVNPDFNKPAAKPVADDPAILTAPPYSSAAGQMLLVKKVLGNDRKLIK